MRDSILLIYRSIAAVMPWLMGGIAVMGIVIVMNPKPSWQPDFVALKEDPTPYKIAHTDISQPGPLEPTTAQPAAAEESLRNANVATVDTDPTSPAALGPAIEAIRSDQLISTATSSLPKTMPLTAPAQHQHPVLESDSAPIGGPPDPIAALESTSAAAVENPRTAQVRTDNYIVVQTARVRREPSTGAAQVGHLQPGIRVSVLATAGHNGTWYEIPWQDGRAYVYKTLLEALPEQAQQPPPKASSGAAYRVRTNARVRSGPSLKFKPLGQLARGQLIRILGRSTSGDWLEIVWREETAFVFAELVEALVPNAPQAGAAALSTGSKEPSEAAETITATVSGASAAAAMPSTMGTPSDDPIVEGMKASDAIVE